MVPLSRFLSYAALAYFFWVAAVMLVPLFTSSAGVAGEWGGLVAGAAEPPPRQGMQQRNTVLLKHFVGFDLRRLPVVAAAAVVAAEVVEVDRQLPLPMLLRLLVAMPPLTPLPLPLPLPRALPQLLLLLLLWLPL